MRSLWSAARSVEQRPKMLSAFSLRCYSGASEPRGPPLEVLLLLATLRPRVYGVWYLHVAKLLRIAACLDRLEVHR